MSGNSVYLIKVIVKHGGTKECLIGTAIWSWTVEAITSKIEVEAMICLKMIERVHIHGRRTGVSLQGTAKIHLWIDVAVV